MVRLPFLAFVVCITYLERATGATELYEYGWGTRSARSLPCTLHSRLTAANEQREHPLRQGIVGANYGSDSSTFVVITKAKFADVSLPLNASETNDQAGGSHSIKR